MGSVLISPIFSFHQDSHPPAGRGGGRLLPRMNTDVSSRCPIRITHLQKLVSQASFFDLEPRSHKGHEEEQKSILGALRVFVVENPLVAAQGPRYVIGSIRD